MEERVSKVLADARERFHERGGAAGDGGAAFVGEPVEAFGETSIEVSRDALVGVCAHLRDHGPFELLADLSAVDFLGIEPPERRFLVAYHLYSFALNARVRLRVFVPEGDEVAPSVTAVWPTANWHEREVWDFFGIRFEGHPDLRRILMPEDWTGFPQRKDYPLGGTKVEYKGALVPPPDLRRQPTTTTGYPGRIS